jgi:hypothetical protein
MCDVSQFAIAEMFGETFILSCFEQSEPNSFESVVMAGNLYVPTVVFIIANPACRTSDAVCFCCDGYKRLSPSSHCSRLMILLRRPDELANRKA